MTVFPFASYISKKVVGKRVPNSDVDSTQGRVQHAELVAIPLCATRGDFYFTGS